MEDALIDFIIKSNKDFKLITELSDDYIQMLKNAIKNEIIEKSNYKNIIALDEMVEVLEDLFCDGLKAINRINNYIINIESDFLEKLKEEYTKDINYEEYEYFEEYKKIHGANTSYDEYWKEARTKIPLNEYTLFDYITIEVVDAMDELSESVLNSDKALFKDVLEIANLYYEDFKDYKPFSKRLKNLIIANALLLYSGKATRLFREHTKENFNIHKNIPKTNQEILNNSYDVVIEELKKLNPSEYDCIELIEQEKNINCELFTNAKILSQLKIGNHYMKFLYKCNSAYTKEYDKIIFSEFVEALISGYTQYLDLKNSNVKKELKELRTDLEVLKRYNSLNENDENIKQVTNRIKFLSTKRPYYKFVIFKELSSKLQIQNSEIANYIINSSIKKSHNRNTILNNFDNIATQKIKIDINYL